MAAQLSARAQAIKSATGSFGVWALMATFCIRHCWKATAAQLSARAQAIKSETGSFGTWALMATFCGLVLVATTFISHTVGAIVILPIVGAVGAQMEVRSIDPGDCVLPMSYVITLLYTAVRLRSPLLRFCKVCGNNAAEWLSCLHSFSQQAVTM